MVPSQVHVIRDGSPRETLNESLNRALETPTSLGVSKVNVIVDSTTGPAVEWNNHNIIYCMDIEINCTCIVAPRILITMCRAAYNSYTCTIAHANSIYIITKSPTAFWQLSMHGMDKITSTSQVSCRVTIWTGCYLGTYTSWAGTAHHALTPIQVNRYKVLYPIEYIKMSTIFDYWSWITGFSS